MRYFINGLQAEKSAAVELYHGCVQDHLLSLDDAGHFNRLIHTEEGRERIGEITSYELEIFPE